MNWSLIIPLALLGLVMGFAAVFGLSPGNESTFWIIIGVASAVLIAVRAKRAWFLHGFLVGLLAGAVAPVIQALLISSYLAHNPEFAARMQFLPGGFTPRTFNLMLAPIAGLVNGLTIAILAWFISKFVRRSPSSSPGAAG